MEHAVIFDCDGVLVDSEVIVTRIEAEMLAELGAQISVEEVVANFTGLSDAVMAEALRRDFGVELPSRFDADRRARISAAFENELQAVPGIALVLDALSRRGVPLAVASSSSPDRIARSLDLTGLSGYFSGHLYSVTMVEHGKPAPDLFLYAADRLGTAPSGCVVVEDSPPGVRAAVTAGMDVVGFVAGGHCGPEHRERLGAAGAGRIASTTDQLQTFLDAPADARGQ